MTLEQSENDNKTREQKKSSKRGGGAEGKAKRAKVNTVLDIIADKGTEMKSIDSRAEGWQETHADIFTHDDEQHRCAPYVIRGVDLSLFENDANGLSKSLGVFMSDFRGSEARRVHKRAMRRNVEEGTRDGDGAANEFVLSRVAELVPAGSVLSPAMPMTEPGLKASASLFNFGVKENSHHSALEKDCIWAVVCRSMARARLLCGASLK